MSGRGFIDLRQTPASGSHTDDSVWPSFTDIMTVVVMIFLMALVGILLKNTDLSSRLKQTIEAEKTASTLAAKRDSESTTLRTSIDRLTASLESLKATKEVLEADNADLTRAYGELEVTQRQSEQLIQLQERSLNAANAQRLAMATSQQAAATDRANLIAQGEAMAQTLAGNNTELENQSSQIAGLAKTLQASEAARTALALTQSQTEQSRVSLINRSRSLTASLETSEQELVAAVERAGDLAAQLASAENDRDDAVGVGERLANQLVTVREELSASTQSTEKLSADLTQQTSEKDRLKKAINKFEIQLQALKDEQQLTARQTQSAMEALRAASSRTVSANLDLKKRLNITADSTEELQAETLLLQNLLAAAKAEQQTALQSLEQESTDKTALQQSLLDAAADRKNIESALNQARADKLSMQKSLDQLQADNLALQETLDQTNAELVSERLAVAQSIQDAERKITLGQRTIDELRQDSQLSESEQQRLLADIESLRVSLEQSEVDTERLVAELEFDRTRYQVLSDTVASIGNEKLDLIEQLKKSKRVSRDLTLEKLRLSALVNELGREADSLKTTAMELEQERGQLYDRLELDQEELEQLQLTYVDLKDKYDKLVGPARSPIGRVVVDIRHYRRGDESVIELREPNWNDFREITQTQLERRLQRLADQHDGNLYTRIIFPQSNGLSYTEALRFETRILQRYDYYERASQSASRG